MTTSLTQQCLAQLKQAIIHGDYQPGDRLNIESLKTKYKMGATPIREALNQLCALGLAEAQPLKGFKVTPISQAELIDIYNSRQFIESHLLQLAMQHGDDQWESEILASHHRLTKLEQDTSFQQEPDIEAWLKRYRDYHNSLFTACQSPTLLRIQQFLYQQSERYRYLRFTNGENTSITLHNKAKLHQQLTQAILQKDEATAQDTLKQLLDGTVNDITQHISAQKN